MTVALLPRSTTATAEKAAQSLTPAEKDVLLGVYRIYCKAPEWKKREWKSSDIIFGLYISGNGIGHLSRFEGYMSLLHKGMLAQTSDAMPRTLITTWGKAVGEQLAS